LDPSGSLIFKHGPVEVLSSGELIGGRATPSMVGFVNGPDQSVVGTYMLNVSVDLMVRLRSVSAIIAVGLSTGLAIWLIGQSLSAPIAGLTNAANKVNSGRLDFEIPRSNICELNQLSTAFTAMRGGIARTPEQLQKYITIALDKTLSLERMIESLFAYAKTEYLNLLPNLEPIYMERLLRKLVEAVGAQAIMYGITIQTGATSSNTIVQVDEIMLTRVVDNLLANAMRFTPPGGIVEVGWQCSSDTFDFWVHDTGPGISPQDLDGIFLPLYRGDLARSSRSGGAGIGLAIAKHLVHAHHGRISVTNDGGAKFTVSLPLSKSDPEPV